MIIDLTQEEINFLKEKFDYINKDKVPYLEMKIYDKLTLEQTTSNLTVENSIKKLYDLYCANCGTSDYAKNYLLSLNQNIEFSLSNLSNFDSNNFEAAKYLFNCLKTENRFKMWDMISKLDFNVYENIIKNKLDKFLQDDERLFTINDNIYIKRIYTENGILFECVNEPTISTLDNMKNIIEWYNENTQKRINA